MLAPLACAWRPSTVLVWPEGTLGHAGGWSKEQCLSLKHAVTWVSFSLKEKNTEPGWPVCAALKKSLPSGCDSDSRAQYRVSCFQTPEGNNVIGSVFKSEVHLGAAELLWLLLQLDDKELLLLSLHA